MTTIQHDVSANKVDFEMMEVLERHVSGNFMSGVDNIDKDKKVGGSFTSCEMFKMCYRTGLLGCFLLVVVNGKPAWNMSTDMPQSI